ncbi:MAG TPA: cache domain-containing protein, partial [Bacillota bacterium]
MKSGSVGSGTGPAAKRLRGLRFRFGIMAKVFGVAVGGVLLAVGLLSGITLYSMNGDVETNAKKQLDLAINLERSLIDQHLARVRDQASAVAESDQVKGALAGRGKVTRDQVARFKAGAANLQILTVVDAQGRVVARANSDQVGQAFAANGLVADVLSKGAVAAAAAVLPEADWAAEGPDLRKLVVIPVKATAGAEERKEKEVTGALVLVAVAPVKGPTGAVAGAVIAAEVLNQNYSIVDEVRDRTNGEVTATVAMDGIRVTTNVRLKDADGKATENRAIGTVYSIPVMTNLRKGEEYRGRAVVAGEWQKTVYVPLKDHTGKVVAGPYVGISEATFTALRGQFIGILVPVAIVGFLIAALMSFLVSRSVAVQVGRVKKAAERIADGDLTIEELKIGGRDEV